MGKWQVLFLLVHGTFDAADSDEGDSWWQTGSAFRAKLSKKHPDAGVRCFRWSGENQHSARVAAARDLARFLRELEDEFDDIRIIAHSHGGNVVNYALNHLPQRLIDKLRVTTVGTPFISTKRHFLYNYNPWDYAGAVGVLFASYFAIESVPGWAEPAMQGTRTDQIEWISIAAFVFLLLRNPGLRFWRFVRRKVARRPRMQVIAHADDEAILLLDKMRTLKLAPLNYSEMRAVIGRLALPLGSLSFMSIAGLILVFPQWFDALLTEADMTIADPDLWINAVIYGVISLFLAVTTIGALGYIVGWPLAKLVNAIVDGALKSGSFGTMGGRSVERIAATPVEPHDVVALPAGLTDEMARNTSDNLGARAGELKRKLTRSLDLDEDGLSLLLETFQWDELIHTYYFRNDRMQDVILAASFGPTAVKADAPVEPSSA